MKEKKKARVFIFFFLDLLLPLFLRLTSARLSSGVKALLALRLLFRHEGEHERRDTAPSSVRIPASNGREQRQGDGGESVGDDDAASTTTTSPLIHRALCEPRRRQRDEHEHEQQSSFSHLRRGTRAHARLQPRDGRVSFIFFASLEMLFAPFSTPCFFSFFFCFFSKPRPPQKKNSSRKMGWRASGLDPFQYHPDRGLYLHEVAPSLLCGTQPRDAREVEILAKEHGVTHIVCLQRDEDAAHWGVDLRSIAREAERRGIRHGRAEARDFDPASLRRALPAAVRLIDEGLGGGGGNGKDREVESHGSSRNRVYVHCTAGLGRAPAACIAWLKWFGGLDLDAATRQVTSARPCGPKRDAVRGASFDLARVPGVTPPFEQLPEHAFSDLSAEERRKVQERVRAGWGWEMR